MCIWIFEFYECCFMFIMFYLFFVWGFVCYRYGLLGKRFKDMFGIIFILFLSGLVGMKKLVDYGVFYLFIEEFIVVYWLYFLLFEKIDIKNIMVIVSSSLYILLIVDE